MSPTQETIRNCFLKALLPADFALLSPYLVSQGLPRRMNLIEENRPVEHVYFPTSGLASIVALIEDRELIEVGAFGFEGLSDFTLDPGNDRVPLRTFMQIGGEGWRIDAVPYAEALERSGTLLRATLRYDQYKSIQFAYTALSHGSFTIVERLARWILMASDRVGDEFSIVHEYMAMMLAVRRAGVTESMHVLEGHHAIESTRNRIRVTDRAKLMELAGGSYGVPEAEYERLIGPFRPRPS